MKPTDTNKSKAQRVAHLSAISAGPALAIGGLLWFAMFKEGPQNDLGYGLVAAIAPYIGGAFFCAALSAHALHVSKADIGHAQTWLLLTTVAAVTSAIGALESPMLAALFVGGAFGASHGLRFVRDRSPAKVFRPR